MAGEKPISPQLADQRLREIAGELAEVEHLMPAFRKKAKTLGLEMPSIEGAGNLTESLKRLQSFHRGVRKFITRIEDPELSPTTPEPKNGSQSPKMGGGKKTPKA